MKRHLHVGGFAKFLVLSLIMAIVLSSISIASCEEKKLEWGMSKEEVREILGSYNSKQDDDRIDIWLYKDQKISKFSSVLAIFFVDDKLTLRCYMISDGSTGNYRYLNDALSSKYGDSTEDISMVTRAWSIFTRERQEESAIRSVFSDSSCKYATWHDESNEVVLMYISGTDNSDAMLGLFYMCEEDAQERDALDSFNMDGL